MLRERRGKIIQNLMSKSISELQQQVDEWIKSVGVRYYSELTNMAILTEEVGELARLMARTYGDQSFKNNEADTDLGEEMADVLFVLICLANQTGVNLDHAFAEKIRIRTERDRDRHQNNPKLQA
jgi:NTP pyrophosphatase (non-canonical NTP hydrolase)